MGVYFLLFVFSCYFCSFSPSYSLVFYRLDHFSTFRAEACLEEEVRFFCVSKREAWSSITFRPRPSHSTRQAVQLPLTKKERYIVGFRHDSPPVLLRVVTEYVVTDGRSLVYTDAQPPYTGTFRVIFQRPGGRAARVTTPALTFHALCTCSLLFFSKNLPNHSKVSGRFPIPCFTNIDLQL